MTEIIDRVNSIPAGAVVAKPPGHQQVFFEIFVLNPIGILGFRIVAAHLAA